MPSAKACGQSYLVPVASYQKLICIMIVFLHLWALIYTFFDRLPTVFLYNCWLSDCKGMKIKTTTSLFGDSRISTHADPTSTLHTIFHERRISSMKLTSAHVYVNVYIGVGDSSNFGLLGEQSTPKWKIPCSGCRWTTVQYLTPCTNLTLYPQWNP